MLRCQRVQHRSGSRSSYPYEGRPERSWQNPACNRALSRASLLARLTRWLSGRGLEHPRMRDGGGVSGYCAHTTTAVTPWAFVSVFVTPISRVPGSAEDRGHRVRASLSVISTRGIDPSSSLWDAGRVVAIILGGARRLLALSFGLALAVTMGVGVSAAAPQPSPLVPGNGSVAGRGYEQWEAAAWQWRLAHPKTTPNTTSCFTAGQYGPIWFLDGSYTKNTSVVTRTCAIPAGRYLMLFGPSIDCSTVEPAPYHATTDAGLTRCAKAAWQRHRGERPSCSTA